MKPHWNEWSEFPKLKISSIPQETKIYFEVILVSASDEQQIIASVSSRIFDEKG